MKHYCKSLSMNDPWAWIKLPCGLWFITCSLIISWSWTTHAHSWRLMGYMSFISAPLCKPVFVCLTTLSSHYDNGKTKNVNFFLSPQPPKHIIPWEARWLLLLYMCSNLFVTIGCKEPLLAMGWCQCGLLGKWLCRMHWPMGREATHQVASVKSQGRDLVQRN